MFRTGFEELRVSILITEFHLLIIYMPVSLVYFVFLVQGQSFGSDRTSTCFMWCKNGLQSFGSILCLFSQENSQAFRSGGQIGF